MSPRYVAYRNKWDPGAWSPTHGRHGDHINLILKSPTPSKRWTGTGGSAGCS